jgi:Zn-dependent protease with chaperone function
MPDARRLARRQRALAFVVLAAALLGIAIAADGLAFHLGAALADIAAGSAPSVAGLLILTFVAAEIALIASAVPAMLRRVRAQRRFVSMLRACGEGEIDGVPVVLVADPRPLVFCAGLLRPRVYLSVGARRRLGPRALRAVLAHEAHHARRRDPLRLLVTGAFGRVPCLAGLARRQEVLTELAADAAAVRAVDGPGPVAAAMLALSEFRVAPERVDQLRGTGVDFRVPAAWLAGALAVLAASLASTLQQVAEPGAPHVCIAELAGGALLVAGAVALARRARD